MGRLMFLRRALGLALGSGVVVAGLLFPPPVLALELITQSEAELPSDLSLGHDRGISRGPTVTVLSPAPNAGIVKSPLSLKLRFQSHGDSKIDIDSVQLIYLKVPYINLTQRIKPFIAATGIDVNDAEVPPGTHTLRVDVKDTNGRSTATDFTFSVAK